MLAYAEQARRELDDIENADERQERLRHALAGAERAAAGPPPA